MITDGKPSCMFEGGKLYKNSFGLDRKIVNKVLDEAVKCRREKITITTFMIASDPYLQHFVREMTEANKGKAYFSSLDNLGGFIFEDYIKTENAECNNFPLSVFINSDLKIESYLFTNKTASRSFQVFVLYVSKCLELVKHTEFFHNGLSDIKLASEILRSIQDDHIT